jgi:glutamine cyclotransferase
MKVSIKIFSTVFYLCFLFLSACNNNNDAPVKPTLSSPPAVVPLINYSSVQTFPHDTTLFTEGLVFYNNNLYESTGAPEEIPYTRSLIIVHDLQTGKFEKKVEIDRKKYFGEGIVFLKDKLYQLTYKNQLGFIYDAKTFKQTGTFTYSNAEGWSLTTDGTYLIMSDGTDKLTFLDPKNLKPVKTLAVTENNAPLTNINELEFIKGFVYANVWTTNYIVKIDTTNGKVIGKLDLSSLALEAKNKNPHADYLNGIAYDSVSDKIYVTGKLYANIYEINFAH